MLRREGGTRFIIAEMNLFNKDEESDSLIVRAAQRSPQLWAIGIGTLLFNGIVLTLGNAYMNKTLAAEETIRSA